MADTRPPLPGRARELALGLLVSALTVAALLGLLEGGLRAFGFAPERYLFPARLITARQDMLLDCYPTNPRGYFEIDLRDPVMQERYKRAAPRRIQAVARRSPWAVEVRYNSRLMREVELTPRTAARRRVMVMGDSFTEGQGVKEKDTCVRRLEALLEKSRPGRYEVRNVARRATDFPELFTLFEEVLPFGADVFVYAMVLNDGDRSPEFDERQKYVNDWILDRRRIQERGEEAPRFQSRLFALLHDRWEAWRTSRATATWYRDMYGPPNAEGWRRTREHIAEMDRRVKAQGGRFLVVLWPLLVGLERSYPFAETHAALAAFCRSAGIEFHDLLPVLRGQQTEELWVHALDMHPNERAQGLAAEALLPLVLEGEPAP